MENIWAQADSGHHKMFRPRWHHPCVENKHQVEKTKMKKKQAQKLLLDLLLLTTSMNAGEKKKRFPAQHQGTKIISGTAQCQR